MCRSALIALMFAFVLLGSCSSSAAQDSDGDGLADAHEQILGSHVGLADAFRVIIDDGLEPEKARAAEGYDATKDVLTVAFCHAGGNRCLWRATFAEAPTPKDTVFHLYVDADNDASTGRKDAGAWGTGTDYMLSAVGGGATSGHYAPNGERTDGPPVYFVVDGNALIVSADVDLGRDAQGISFSLYVLCHSTTKPGEGPRMSDSVPKTLCNALATVDRPEVKRPTDLAGSQGVDGTFGLDILRALLARDDVIVIGHDKLDLDGFEVTHQTSRRYPHVKRLRPLGVASARAPKAGRYHVGFMMYDDGNDERVVIKVAGKVLGTAVANCDNNRTWAYWTQKPYEFRGGETVELIAAGGSGQHGICNLLFLPEPPEIRGLPYAVANFTAYTPVGGDGQVTLSWTTGWPCPTRFEYGPTGAYGLVAVADTTMLVHRVVLEGLDPAAEYHGRAVGTRKDGTHYTGPAVTFRAKAPEPPATASELRQVAITVRNPHDVSARGWPVTGGVPFAPGVLGDSAHVRLLRNGEEVAAQIETTGRWLEGSVKWLLLTFLADVPAGSRAEYALEFGRGVARRAVVKSAVSVVEADGGVVIDTGAMRLPVNGHGDVVLPSGGTASTHVYGKRGGDVLPEYWTASAAAAVTVEESGPLRAVVKTVCKPASASEQVGATGTLLQIEQRIVAYAGAPFVRVYHTFIVDGKETFTELESVSWALSDVSAVDRDWLVPLADGGAEKLRRPAGGNAEAVMHEFDHEYGVVHDGGETTARQGRIVGALIGSGTDGFAVAVRDFWQQYPKGLVVGPQHIKVLLCDDFAVGTYDAFPFEKEGHQLYYYLQNGRYKFKRGMAKTHEMFLCFAPEAEREGLCRLFQRPLLATVDPAWTCATGAFYDVAPRDETRFKAYEEAIDTNLKRYVETRERQHDYGLMNYGDWYGERGANWGNIEYDTQHAFFLEYIRSGNPDAFFLGEATELHNRDIDTIQWSPDPAQVGAVYVHQMGHVGGYYNKSVPGTLGIPSAGYTVSHAWAEGHFNHYFLTGDRRSLETGKAVADFFIRKMLSHSYEFSSCRTPGWQLMINAIAYASTSDPYYLNASRVIVDRVLETQDTVPRPLPDYQCEEGRTHQFGGWSRMMVPGHCHCTPRHRGNAGFMVAVLLSGLKYFHDVTGDARVKECIINGAYSLLEETYSDEVQGFRYTSCPEMRHRAGASPLMVEGVARAYLWTRDERFKRVLTEALPRGAGGSSYGKGFSMYYRVAPRVLADLAATGLTLNARISARRIPFQKPEWLSKLKPEEVVIVQAEDVVEQGGGEVQIRDDRQATWGKMITYWHRDVGHWLEWEFEVPRAGDYVVRFRYATASEETSREFRLDGKVPFGAASAVRFPRTGGFGNNAGDWRVLSLTGEDGQERSLAIGKGRHRIRMTNLKDGLGLDFMALVRCDQGR